MERLRKHILNELVFNIDGDEFVVHPLVGDKVRLLEKVGKAPKGEHIKVFTDYIKELIQRDAEDIDEGIIDGFVDSNLDELIKQLSIGFKLAKPEQFEVASNEKN